MVLIKNIPDKGRPSLLLNEVTLPSKSKCPEKSLLGTCATEKTNASSSSSLWKESSPFSELQDLKKAHREDQVQEELLPGSLQGASSNIWCSEETLGDSRAATVSLISKRKCEKYQYNWQQLLWCPRQWELGLKIKGDL